MRPVIPSGAHVLRLASVHGVNEFEALQAWTSVVGTARLEPMARVHNAIWRVRGQDGRDWVLKHLPEWPPGVGPVEEYRVLCYLQAGGLPVAVPIITDEGLIAHNADNLGTDPVEKQPTGTDAYALIPLLPHDPTRPELPELARTIGRAIGRLDRLLADCPWHVTSFTDDPANDTLGDGYPTLPDELRALVDPLRGELRAALTGLPTQLSHGDCNVGNVLVHDGRVSGFIDLDHLPHSPRVRDLSVYLASHLRHQITDGEPNVLVGQLRHYVAGYHESLPLSDHELAAVVPLLLTVLIGNAGWCLHGWEVDRAGYRRCLQAIQWIAPRYRHLVAAAEV